MNSKNKEIENLSSYFLNLANQLVSFTITLGYKHIKATKNTNLIHFNSLNLIKQKKVIHNLELFIKICEKTITMGNSLNNSRQLIWYAIKELGFSFDSSLFELIEETDTVEIYSFDNIQIFRNFKFYEDCSYSIEDLYCRPWPTLFKRVDVSKTQKTIDLITKFYTKENLAPVSATHLGFHRVIELHSPLKYEIDLLVKTLAPIFDSEKQPCGFISIENCKFIGPDLTTKEEEYLLDDYYKPIQTPNLTIV